MIYMTTVVHTRIQMKQVIVVLQQNLLFTTSCRHPERPTRNIKKAHFHHCHESTYCIPVDRMQPYVCVVCCRPIYVCWSPLYSIRDTTVVVGRRSNRGHTDRRESTQEFSYIYICIQSAIICSSCSILSSMKISPGGGVVSHAAHVSKVTHLLRIVVVSSGPQGFLKLLKLTSVPVYGTLMLLPS